MNIDLLYQTPLAEFVTARNELARALKRAGDADGAKQVQALTKPSASAWAVNQLYWRERTTFEAMIDAGDRLRAALESGPGGDAELSRTEAIEKALRRTRAILEASGQNATDTLMRRIATTLDALASFGSANPDPMRGRLSEDVDPPGFGAFAAMRPALAESNERTPEDELFAHEAAVAGAKANLEEATARVTHLEAELERTEQRLLDAHKAAEDAAVKHAEAETKLEEAKARAKLP